MTNGFTRYSSPWLQSGFKMVELPLQHTIDTPNKYFDCYLNGEWLGSKRWGIIEGLLNDRFAEYQAEQKGTETH